MMPATSDHRAAHDVTCVFTDRDAVLLEDDATDIGIHVDGTPNCTGLHRALVVVKPTRQFSEMEAMVER